MDEITLKDVSFDSLAILIWIMNVNQYDVKEVKYDRTKVSPWIITFGIRKDEPTEN